jgi:hypothetical protein
MNFGLLIGLTRARVALLIAGLAWFVGLDAPLAVRVLIAVLVIAGVAGDGWVDEQRIRHQPAPDRTRTPA